MKYPSLHSAYERIQDVLWQQAQTADHLDSKAATFWSIATAIIGIGVPIALSIDNASVKYETLWLMPILSYGIGTIGFLIEYFPRRFELMNHPGYLRDDFWELEPAKFEQELALLMEGAFLKNASQLKWKTWSLWVIAVL